MKINSRLVSVTCISFYAFLALAKTAFVAYAAEPLAPEQGRRKVEANLATGSDQYVTPQGAGDRSGRNWANARSALNFQDALDRAGSNNTVRVSSGTYENVTLQVNTGGASAKAKKAIVGVDTGGGLPLFKSDFNRQNPSKTGATLVSIEEGVSYILFKNLKVSGYRIAVQLQGRHRGVRIQNVDVTNVRDAFWIVGGATPDAADVGTRDLIVRDCDVKNFTKRGFRIFGGVSKSQFINCHVDAGGKEFFAETFPIGFHIIGGEGGIVDKELTFTNCSAANAWHEGTGYWNGDGFVAEGAPSDLTWKGCLAYGNSDGGWDIKTLRPKLVDCVSIANKRNFRVWDRKEMAAMENCLAAFSIDAGQKGHNVGVWLKGGGHLSMTRCTLWGDKVGLAVEDGDEENRTQLILNRCLVVPAEGAVALSLSPGVDLQNVSSLLRQNQNDLLVRLRKPSQKWHGDNSFDSISHPQLGYHYQNSLPQKQPR